MSQFGALQDRVRRDLEAQINMSALVLEQVFSVADDHGVPLAVDMSRTEDEGTVARVPQVYRYTLALWTAARCGSHMRFYLRL